MQTGPVYICEARNTSWNRRLQRSRKSGDLQRIGDGIYVHSDVENVPAAVLEASLAILGKFSPGSVLYGACGAVKGPIASTADPSTHWLYATHVNGTSRKFVSLPGLELRSTPGIGPLEGDVENTDGVYFPSLPRQLLENLRTSRKRVGPSRTLGMEVVKSMMAGLFRTGTIDDVLLLASSICGQLEAAEELEILVRMKQDLLNGHFDDEPLRRLHPTPIPRASNRIPRMTSRLSRTTDAQTGPRQEGWIYIAANPFMPGVVKIGLTTRDVRQRIKQLGNTSVPGQFDVLRSYSVSNAYYAERLIHDALKGNRTDANREFFKVSAEKAMEVCSSTLAARSGLLRE